MYAVRRGLLVLLLILPAVAHAQPYDFSAVDDAVQAATASGDIPGAVVLIGQGDEVLYHRAFGSRSLVPNPQPMTTDTIFDIASLTKPVGTTLAVMALVERGAVRLDVPLGKYLKEFRSRALEGVTVRRVLTHSAGLPAIPNGRFVARNGPITQAIARAKLDYPPGTAFQYSDTGFILLGELVRRVSGQPLDESLARLVFRPLRLPDTSFHPPAAKHARIAPTEFHNGRMLQGEVHDPRARSMGGVAGHAGMFSTAADLARITRMLLAGGVAEGHRLLKSSTVQLMWSRSAEGRGARALGWDMTSPYATAWAPFFPAGSVGHTGFTGTSLWIDPEADRIHILLTNRVHPRHQAVDMNAVRREFHALTAAL
jgi:CubicO group peptidase (beta-lactamase class C family)